MNVKSYPVYITMFKKATVLSVLLEVKLFPNNASSPAAQVCCLAPYEVDMWRKLHFLLFRPG